MASITDIPFNFNPVSVTTHTSSTSIPSGRYAFVTAQVRNGGSFTIDGTTALNSSAASGAYTNVAVTGSTGGTVNHTVSSGKRFEGQVSSATGSTNIGSQTSTGYKAGPGQAITVSAGSGQIPSIFGVEIPLDTPGEFVTGSFWVPSGTSLNGSGDFRFTVSQFNA